MEPLWMKWLRENAPAEINKEIISSLLHEQTWRDAEIKRLQTLCGSALRMIEVNGCDNESDCGNCRLCDFLKDAAEHGGCENDQG